MKKFVPFIVVHWALAACAAPTPATLIVTATPEPAPTLVPPTATPTEEPTADPPIPLTITSPEAGSSWESTDFVQVTGSARGLAGDEILVFFMDVGRNIHGYACARIGAPDIAEVRAFETTLTAPVGSITEGTIMAGAFDADPAQSAAVSVSALADSDDRHVTIKDPGNRCVVTTPSSFEVSGSEQGIFENRIVVQALDAGGTVLAEALATPSFSAAGRLGVWSVRLSVNVSPGAQGQLVAFSPDPAGGEPLSSPTYTVYFGE